MKNIITDKRGFILLLTFIFMTVLTVITGALIYMTASDMRNIAPQSDDVNMEGLADAGIERAHRAIRDDYINTTSTGAADLRGGDTSLSVSVGNPNNMRYIDSATSGINSNSDQAILRTFDSSYMNTRIISVQIHVRADRDGSASGAATIQAAYTTDGVSYTPVITRALTTTVLDYYVTVPVLASWSILMGSNFRLRTMRVEGNSSVNLESMFLRVTYGIDTPAEDWATGSYASFPVSLSGGTIESVTVTDEASKVHLNYASQALLSNLLTNLSIASAPTKATNIVSYRGVGLTNPFDSVEELQQVTGITAADYAAIKDYVTVYSFVNSNVFRPTGPRAPVNINTASFEVLKAIFDSLNLGASDPISLANDIITFRGSTPFTCFYSSNAAVTTDFFDFVDARAYLSNAERNRVVDNCDASSLVPVSGFGGQNCLTTELCYAGYSFMIDSLAKYNNRKLRVKTLRGNDGAHVFSTHAGDTVLSGWRKENFE
ncbi:MAG: type II secretion system protein GspK [Candidatus Omnitrophota bacterium]|nr:type II secretion system protein GspK [Candidatus Omnitrophota bacterium]